ncbi:peptidoglycan-binding domain-containing protein [Sorangium sp. So ce119]|uniref:peptidoglycan-binding domain-containing protein n=1 Tax=Sorangium sp. So ce119 TaxID=3133279 RepID=UPI003F5E6795
MAKPWVPYVIQQGDHLRKLAFRFGMEAETLWRHEKNQALSQRRKNMDLLHPGDVLHVPAEPAPALELSAGTMNRYKARVPTIPVKLQLESAVRSLAGQRFEVHGVGEGVEPICGTTTAEGEAAFDVPVLVREVELRLPDAGLVIPVLVGDLDPIDEPSGVAQRLRNLGFLPPIGEVEAEDVTLALMAFQREQGLAVTGAVDDETRRALEARHRL